MLFQSMSMMCQCHGFFARCQCHCQCPVVALSVAQPAAAAMPPKKQQQPAIADDQKVSMKEGPSFVTEGTDLWPGCSDQQLAVIFHASSSLNPLRIQKAVTFLKKKRVWPGQGNKDLCRGLPLLTAKFKGSQVEKASCDCQCSIDGIPPSACCPVSGGQLCGLLGRFAIVW